MKKPKKDHFAPPEAFYLNVYIASRDKVPLSKIRARGKKLQAALARCGFSVLRTDFLDEVF